MATQAASRRRETALKGNLRDFPFAHLLLALLDERRSGTLVLGAGPGVVEARVRFENGLPTAAQGASIVSTLEQALIPLCAHAGYEFVFVDGELAPFEGQAVIGSVDPVAVIARAMHGPVREDAVERLLSQIADRPLKLSPSASLERYGFGPRERAVAEALRLQPLPYSELRARTDLPDRTLRRLVYLLCVTRVLAVAQLGRHMVSGTISHPGAPPSLPAPRASTAPDASSLSGVRTRALLAAAPHTRLLPGSVMGTSGRYHVVAPEETTEIETALPSTPPAAKSSLPPLGARRSRAPELPESASAEQHGRRAEQLLKRADYAGALESARRAFDLDGSPRHEALCGWLIYLRHSATGRVHPEAFEWIKRAIKREPSCAQAHFYKACILKQTGRLEEAQVHFRRVLKIDPDHVEAEREVRLFEARRKRSGLIVRLLEGDARGKSRDV